MNNEITLDLYEMQSAAHLGILRCLESKKHKENWGYSYKGSFNDQMAKSISGAMGEVAASKFLNIKFEYHCNVGGVPDLILFMISLHLPPVFLSAVIVVSTAMAGKPPTCFFTDPSS